MKSYPTSSPGHLPHLRIWALLLLGLFGTCSIAGADVPPLPGAKVIALDRQASEAGPDEGSFIVLRTGSTAQGLTVFYSVSGTAEEGTDYQALPGFVTIPPGFASAPVVVNPIDDLEPEDRETVILTVIDPPGGETYIPCWPFRARVAIADDDTEANTPPRVKIVNPKDGSVFVGPDSIALVAKANDADGFVRTVEFFDGDTSLGVVSYPRPLSIEEIASNPDLLEAAVAKRTAESGVGQTPGTASDDGALLPELEGDSVIQIFRLRWEKIGLGEHVLTALATDTDGAQTLSGPIVITVEKGPVIPVVKIIAVDPIATEEGGLIKEAITQGASPSIEDESNTSRPNNAHFIIKRRAADISRPLHVFFRVLGTATNGDDFRRIPHHVTIPADAYAVRVTVRPFDDALVEGRESVIIRLVPQVSDEILREVPGYYRVGHHGVARAVIIDNDSPPGNLPPHVRLVRPHNGDVFKAGSSISLLANASDKDGYIKSVEFFEGTTSLGIIENPLVQPTDGSVKPLSASARAKIRTLPLYRISWENVPAGGYVITAVATDNNGEETTSSPVEIKVIAGNPGPVVTVFTRDPRAKETSNKVDFENNTASFVVARRGGIIERPLTVYYRMGGKAENGVDYRQLTGSVTIEANAYKAQVLVAPIDDLECEGTESVFIKLVPPVVPHIDRKSDVFRPYRIGVPSKARAIIEDNDQCPDNHPPEVTIVLPFNGMVFQAPVSVPFFALANDPDGEVREVALFADSMFIGRAVRIGPYFRWVLFGLEWQDAPAGEYKLVAVAVDNEGAITRSHPVAIEVLAEEDSQVGAVSGTTVTLDGVVRSTSTEAVASAFREGGTLVDDNGEVIEIQNGYERDDTLANISTRGQVKTGSKKMIAGFVISGTGTKQVMIRAVGPSLSAFGVPGALENPVLELFTSGTSTPGHTNDDWETLDPESVRDASARVGAFNLNAGSTDSVLLLSLPPGGYTAHVSGLAGGIGVGLVEIYDGDDPALKSSSADIINISTRGEIGTASDVLIAGFVISGSSPKRVLIRGVGPTLATFGVPGTLLDPRLELFAAADGAQAPPFTANDDWEDYERIAVADAGASTGSFPLEAGSADAAIVTWLEPGAYTVKMSGKGDGIGVGLIEVYEVP